MTKVFHTARVTGISIKITNLGNRTTFVTATNAVNYANANSQTTIGIWENLELLAPINMGEGITHETLYGKSLEGYPDGDNKDPDHSTAQAHIMDNTVKYVFTLNGTSNKFHLPPLIMESTILYNATNSIGPIYDKSYKPSDGTFHSNNVGFENSDKILRKNTHLQCLNIGNQKLKDTVYAKKMTKKYTEATIDNNTIGGLMGTGGTGFMGSVGIGIIPLLNVDGTLEDAVLNILVETSINLECLSHGTNLLMTDHGAPQPNTNYTGLSADKYKWANKYTVAGHPSMEEIRTTTTTTTPGQRRTGHSVEQDTTKIPTIEQEPQPVRPNVREDTTQGRETTTTTPVQIPRPDPEPTTPAPQPGPSVVDTGPTGRAVDEPRTRWQKKRKPESAAVDTTQVKKAKLWYDEGELGKINDGDVLMVRAEKIQGQRRINNRHTNEKKLEIARTNEIIREKAVKEAEKVVKKRIILIGKFLNLGIPEGGYYDETNEAHKKAIIETATPKPPTTTSTTTAATTTEAQRATARPAVTEPTPTPQPESRHYLWLNVYYPGYNFRIILHDQPLGEQGDWTAEGKVFVHEVPTVKEEEMRIKAETNARLWNAINRQLSSLSEDKKSELYFLIRKCYRGERHGGL